MRSLKTFDSIEVIRTDQCLNVSYEIGACVSKWKNFITNIYDYIILDSLDNKWSYAVWYVIMDT